MSIDPRSFSEHIIRALQENPGENIVRVNVGPDDEMGFIDEFKSHIDRIFLEIDEHNRIPRNIPNSELEPHLKDNAAEIVTAIQSYVFNDGPLEQIVGNGYRAIAIDMSNLVAAHEHRKAEMETIFNTITNEAFTDLPKFIRSLHEPMAGGVRRIKKYRRRATKRARKQKRSRRTRSRRA